MEKDSKLDFRLTAEDREKLAELAQLHGRSVAAEIRAALDAWFDAYGPGMWLDDDAAAV